ncbi:GNAT family N-acetyltransferase [Weissella koreensis]|uniref:GNAT family N-acetyltransferase n=1 Tax=Weissella koreensis TaxID=165096 RepID=A0A7H1MML6_9LACO|nr:GNAT family protein [Weissella koreensis]AEJ23875.1 acetyltransferase (putative) [Weissella koreensis KACC 15510]AVH75500.1 N-acetyltransferase [Weissella koreensis]EJF34479.1 GNAT family acetyltransferase [Weissella koreensis KCTC 3621]QGN20722.1 GNAT family N-acetyltransferase [Weissella koreensis]QNT64702.1 GNAT family N-acetyltransferase [Weissella koreensis]
MAMIYLRKATLADLDQIDYLIKDAKKLLAADGIPQWQGDYPQKTDILADLEQGMTYLLIVDQQILGTATLMTIPEPNYQNIYHGGWRTSDQHYATIHRIAIKSDQTGQHLSDFIFSNLLSEAIQLGFKEIRIDTHRQNLRMQHVLEKIGFEYRGIVYMDSNPADRRNAYQLFLDKKIDYLSK